MHDESVERTTNGTGLICEKTFEELIKHNAGDVCNPAVVPEFEKFLALACKNNILINIELKEYSSNGNMDRCIFCIEECIKLIEKYNYAEKAVFNCFDAFVLEYIAEKYKGKYMLHGKIYNDVSACFPDYNVFIGVSSSFDMAPKPYDKYYAIDLYCKENNLSTSNIVYVGDDYGPGGNDSSFITQL